MRSASTRRWLLLLAIASFVAPAEAGRDPMHMRLRSEIEHFVKDRSDPDARVFVPPLLGLVPTPPPPDLVFELSTARLAGLEGLVPVTVVMRDGPTPLTRAVVTVKVEALARVVIAKRALRSGELIREDDLTTEARLRDRLPAGWTDDASMLIGKRMQRSVRANAPIPAAWVEDPPTVQRGQSVTLRLQRGALRIDMKGRAREDGRPGDMIRVQSPSSGRDVSGLVDAEGVVRVSF